MKGIATLFCITLADGAFAQDSAPFPVPAFREAPSSVSDAEKMAWRNRFNQPRFGEDRQTPQGPPQPQGPAKVASTSAPLYGDFWQRWQVEFHVGTGISNAVSGGTGSLPPAGPVIPAGSPLPIPPNVAGYSRQVPSWYFGDGAALFNATVGRLTGSTISPLDPILTDSIASWRGSSLGGRVEKGFSRWLSAEFEMEYGAQRSLTSDVSSQLSQTSGSFETAWQASLNSIPIASYVASTLATTDNQGRQLLTVGNLVVNAPFRISPYLAVGGGLMSIIGGASAATLGVTLSGHYSVASGQAGAAEMDTVNLSVVPLETRMPVLSAGAGVKALITEHLGVRADARIYRYHDRSTTILTATPVPAGAWSQFLNTTDPNVVLYQFQTRGYSSLGGPGVSNVVTFTADGTATQYVATAGVFWRF